MIDGVLKATSTALPPANPPEGAPRQIPAPRRRKSCRRDASQLRSTPSADQFLWATGALARSSKSCRRRPRWCARFLRTICGLARLAHWPLRSNVKASSQNQGVSSTAKQSGFDLRRSNHPMSLSQANKKGVRYRYYVSQPGASAKEPRSIVVRFCRRAPSDPGTGLACGSAGADDRSNGPYEGSSNRFARHFDRPKVFELLPPASRSGALWRKGRLGPRVLLDFYCEQSGSVCARRHEALPPRRPKAIAGSCW